MTLDINVKEKNYKSTRKKYERIWAYFIIKEWRVGLRHLRGPLLCLPQKVPLSWCLFYPRHWGHSRTATTQPLPHRVPIPAAGVTEPKLILLTARQARKLGDKLLQQGTTLLIGKLADREDTLASQKKHLPSVRIPGSFYIEEEEGAGPLQRRPMAEWSCYSSRLPRPYYRGREAINENTNKINHVRWWLVLWRGTEQERRQSSWVEAGWRDLEPGSPHWEGDTDLEEEREQLCRHLGGRAFQVEGTASAKALRLECIWCIHRAEGDKWGWRRVREMVGKKARESWEEVFSLEWDRASGGIWAETNKICLPKILFRCKGGSQEVITVITVITVESDNVVHGTSSGGEEE